MRQWAGLSAAGVVAVCLLSTSAATQPMSRLATTRAQLLKFPLFYHSRPVALVDTPRLTDGVWRLPADAGRLFAVVFRTAPSGEGPVEIRGTFVDVGRFAPDDSRITAFLLSPVVQAATVPGGGWPARETVFAMVNAVAAPREAARTPSLRMIALEPEAWEGKPLTVRGRFRGRNLQGDMPSWPRQSASDFVLQAADGAIWVTGAKPKGKGFDLDPQARRDLGRWLEVSGTLTIAERQPMLKATAIAQSSPDDEGPLADDAPPPPPMPAPAIAFSAPTDGETDIAPTATVRIQFTRDMKSGSFDGHVTVTCTAAGAVVPAPAFTVTYRPATLAVELKFAGPLPRQATVVVQLGDGIVTATGEPLPPAKITFTTGG